MNVVKHNDGVGWSEGNMNCVVPMILYNVYPDSGAVSLVICGASELGGNCFLEPH